jgi:hypothetical protein
VVATSLDGSAQQVASTYINPEYFESAGWQHRHQNSSVNLNSRTSQADPTANCGRIDFSYLLGKQNYVGVNHDLFLDLCRTMAAFFTQ